MRWRAIFRVTSGTKTEKEWEVTEKKTEVEKGEKENNRGREREERKL